MDFLKKPIAYLVVAFICLFALAECNEAYAEPRQELLVGLGLGVLGRYDAATTTVTYLHDQRWGVGYERFRDVNTVHAFRRVYFRKQGWRPLMELGLVYFDDKIENAEKDDGRPIIGCQFTYHLATGIQRELSDEAAIELKWVHNSTASRCNPNTGIDRVVAGFTWRF